MAADAVAITPLTKNAGVAAPAGVAISYTNGASVAAPKKARNLVLVAANTITNATHTVTIKAGAYPPGSLQGQGDLAIPIAASTTAYITLEHARFVQSDGTISVTYSTNMTGTLAALEVPGTI